MNKHANRGMGLEKLIEHANLQYESRGIAQIQKVATPWKVIRRGKDIVSAFPEKKSTVDFMGVYRGRAIAFDAKVTELKTRFPNANIEKHQITFMDNWQRIGGSAFFIIEFKIHKEVYLLPFSEFTKHGNLGRESIPYKWFKEQGIRLDQGNGVVLDYLKHVEVPA